MKNVKILSVLFIISLTIIPNVTHAVTCRPSYDDDSYCKAHGYQLTGNDGCTAGTCIFPDGSSCLSTDFYDGNCGREFKKELACTENGERVPSYRECCDGQKLFHIGPGGFATWRTCESNFIYYSTKLLRAWPLILVTTFLL